MRTLAAAALALCIAAPAWAQVHEVREGAYLLRSTTVASDRIDPRTAARHGIEPSSSRAVLNVVVLKNPESRGGEPVPAELKVMSRNLAGVRRDIPMKEVRENGRVSYIGSYEFLPREVFDFQVTARPRQEGRQPELTLVYRERMWSR